MAKRFTATEKWDDAWYASLPNDHRIIWQYILDKCTMAGRLEKNFRNLNFNCNTNIDEKEFKNIFKGRVVDMGGFFFIPKFLKFQYPRGLNSNKPAIKSIRNEVYDHNLYGIVRESLGNDYLTVKDKDKDKDKVKDKVKVKVKVKDKGSDPTRFKKPSIEELTEYATSVDYYSFDAERFFDFYESKGWMVGKNKMKSWEASVRNWRKGDKSDKPKPELPTRPATMEEAKAWEAFDGTK